jgi:hypothetical protein
MKVSSMMFLCLALAILVSAGTTNAQCLLNCPAGDGGTIGPGMGNHSPDTNGDGSVDLIDFARFAAIYPSPPMTYDPCLDFNCDGQIDLIDFTVFAVHWTHSGAAAGFCIP